MNKKSNFSIILTLDGYKKEQINLLENAVESIKTNEGFKDVSIIVADTKKDTESAVELLEKEFSNVTVVECNGNDAVNKAALSCTTKYFTVLRFNDEFTSKAFSNFEEYGTKNDASVYLSLVKVFSEDEGKETFLGFANEIAWASSFADEYGYIKAGELSAYHGFITYGGFFRTEDFISLNGLDLSVEGAEWYEYLSRVILSEKRIYVIPKCGYKKNQDVVEYSDEWWKNTFEAKKNIAEKLNLEKNG